MGRVLGGHADEHETSLVLVIEPDAVRMARLRAQWWVHGIHPRIDTS